MDGDQHRPAVARVEFRLAIEAGELMRHYRGQAACIRVRASDGNVLQLPASSMRRFVSHAGLYGRFAITYDGEHRLRSIERID